MLRNFLTFYIPPNPKWVDRIDAACSIIEEFCPFGKMNTITSDGNLPDYVIDDRQVGLKKFMKHSAWRFNLTNGRKGGRTPQGMLDELFIRIGGRFNTLDRSVYDLNLDFGAESWEECEELFASIGDAVDAYSSYLFPPAASKIWRAFQNVSDPAMGDHISFLQPDVVQDAVKIHAGLNKINKKLPSIPGYPVLNRLCPQQPLEVGWINYWSNATCEYLNFPNLNSDTELLNYSYQTSKGAWIFKVTQEPFEFERLDHLERLARVYELYPKLILKKN